MIEKSLEIWYISRCVEYRGCFMILVREEKFDCFVNCYIFFLFSNL